MLSEFEHPSELTVKVYVVVLSGEAVGVRRLIALRPVGGAHVYVPVDAVPCKTTVFPCFIVTSGPAFTEGVWFTKTVKERDKLHPPVIAVTVYGVVKEGDRIGFKTEGLLTPAVGVQVNVVPLLLKFVLNDAPWHIVVSKRDDSVRAVGTVTVKVLLREQLVPKNAVTVYGVVTVGESMGLAAVGLLTPEVGDQVKEVPLVIVLALKEAPGQIVVSICAINVRLFVNPMVTGKVVMQLFASVIVAVYIPGARLVAVVPDCAGTEFHVTEYGPVLPVMLRVTAPFAVQVALVIDGTTV